MRDQTLSRRQSKGFKVRTTDSNHDEPIAPNRLAEMPPPSAPNQVLAGDITYIETAEGWFYLAAVLDLYSRAIVGWAMGDRIDTALVLAAWQMTPTQRQLKPGVMFHSDRGIQYASEAYRQAVHQPGAIASMSRKANCYDNATMESFWSTLKWELVYRREFATKVEARLAIFDFIETFYNRQRLHSSLHYFSTFDFENCSN